MRPTKPGKMDKKHPETARDTMEDIKGMGRDAKRAHNDIRYVGANRDRALGEADRTGRHYDEEGGPAPDEEAKALEESKTD
jgi:hypothetical protein